MEPVSEVRTQQYEIEKRKFPLPKIDLKAFQTAIKALFGSIKSNSIQWVRIGQGAVKSVYGKNSAQNVWLFARNTILERLFRTNTREIKEEIKLAKTIKREIEALDDGSQSKFLVIDYKEAEKNDVLGAGCSKRRAIATSAKASGTLKEAIQEESQNFEQLTKFGRHFLSGLSVLHKVGYVHGDVKPDNTLIFTENDERILKLSDFGKSQKMSKNDPQKPYLSNMRFAPPEYALSQKGDVYGAALSIIAMLEAPLLDNTGKMPKHDTLVGDGVKYNGDRKGIERFVVQHNAFLATEKNPLAMFRRLQGLVGLRSDDEKKRQSEVVVQYATEVARSLQENNLVSETQKIQLIDLITKMTVYPPEHRCTSDEALTEYNKIFSP